jgi:hypothetical protein
MTQEATKPDNPSFLQQLYSMRWPAVVFVAVVGLFFPSLAKEYDKVLNKPDVVDIDGSTQPAPITQEEMANLFAKTLETVLPKLLPKPKEETKPAPPVVVKDEPKPVSPNPVVPDKPIVDGGELAISVTDEQGKPIAGTVEAGQLFRVSPKNAKGKVAWQASKNGAVRLVASTDGTEHFGYLEDGQWIDFALTDFEQQKQVTLRITCNQGPQPPPVVDNTKPVPSKGPVSLFVLYDKNLPASAAAIMTSTDVWNSFKANGSDWRFLSVADQTVLGMKVKDDNGNTQIPSLLIYERASMRLLSTQPLPLTTEALISVVKKHTGG